MSGTLAFTVEYRFAEGEATVTGGQWSLTTTSRDRAASTSVGAIAAGARLAVGANGLLTPGSLNLSLGFGDPAWPVSAILNVPLDGKGRLKGNFLLEYPVIP